MLEEKCDLAARALTHFQAGTSDLAEATMEVPISAYQDSDRYAKEVQAVFRQSPIVAALSVDLPEDGSYLAQEIAGTPLLLVRGTDGVVRAFLNVCRHRGARVCEPGRGQRTRFTCPYHAWTYDQEGSLTHLYGADKFGDFDRDTRGLLQLACAERSGLVFVCLDPQHTFDADVWLGGMQARLDSLGLADNWVLYEQRELPGAGWKATMDGYLEVYHHDIVHRTTVGRHTIGNLLVHDTFGPHQRLTFARRTIEDLQQPPTDEAQAESYIRLIHSVFPNLSVSGILGGHCLVSQIFPGPTPDCTITRQSILCAPGADDAAWHEAAQNFSQLALEAVRDEDYAVVATVQASLASISDGSFLFGRNEPGLQHYHRTVEQICSAGESERRAMGLTLQHGQNHAGT